jgi:hypothetical protein
MRLSRLTELNYIAQGRVQIPEAENGKHVLIFFILPRAGIKSQKRKIASMYSFFSNLAQGGVQIPEAKNGKHVLFFSFCPGPGSNSGG